MLDAYSYVNGPSVDEAIHEILSCLKYEFDESIVTNASDDIKLMIKSYHKRQKSFGSYSSWAVFHRKYILEKCRDEILTPSATST